MIQAAGNPRWMAQLHLCELPVFLFALWWFTNRYGIIGTAIASALRYSLDAAAVVLSSRASVVSPAVALEAGSCAPGDGHHPALPGLVGSTGLQPRLLLLAGGLVVCGFFSWNYVLDGGLRARTLQLVAISHERSTILAADGLVKEHGMSALFVFVALVVGLSLALMPCNVSVALVAVPLLLLVVAARPLVGAILAVALIFEVIPGDFQPTLPLGAGALKAIRHPDPILGCSDVYPPYLSQRIDRVFFGARCAGRYCMCWLR